MLLAAVLVRYVTAFIGIIQAFSSGALLSALASMCTPTLSPLPQRVGLIISPDPRSTLSPAAGFEVDYAGNLTNSGNALKTFNLSSATAALGDEGIIRLIDEHGRPVRVVFSILVLLIFVAYLHFSNHPLYKKDDNTTPSVHSLATGHISSGPGANAAASERQRNANELDIILDELDDILTSIQQGVQEFLASSSYYTAHPSVESTGDFTSADDRRISGSLSIPVSQRVPEDEEGNESGTGLDDLDDGRYLCAALGLTNWSDVPPHSGYSPTLDDCFSSPRCENRKPEAWYIADEELRVWVFPRPADLSGPGAPAKAEAVAVSVAGEAEG